MINKSSKMKVFQAFFRYYSNYNKYFVYFLSYQQKIINFEFQTRFNRLSIVFDSI